MHVASLALAALLSATPSPSPPAPMAPPVRTLVVPTPAIAGLETLAEGDVGTRHYQLQRYEDRMYLVGWRAGAPTIDREISPIDRPDVILALLADRKFAFAWPAIEAWAGPDLGRDRERRTRELAVLKAGVSRGAAKDSAESVVSPKVTSLIRATGIHVELGDLAGAEAILREYLAGPVPRRASSWGMLDWVVVKARLAGILQLRGDSDGALRELEEAERTAGRGPWALNASVNRGAMLAEAGRYAEALAVATASWEEFQRAAGSDGVAGSDRQYAWIRACALHGLGRHAEAVAVYRTVADSGAVVDPDFVIDSKRQIEWRATLCRRDDAAMKALLLNHLADDRLTTALVSFQPGYVPLTDRNGVFARLRSDPEIKAALDARMRVLPDAVQPVLHRYDGVKAKAEAEEAVR